MFAHLLFVAVYLVVTWRLAVPDDLRVQYIGTGAAVLSFLFRLRSKLAKRKFLKLVKNRPKACPKCQGELEKLPAGILSRAVISAERGLTGILRSITGLFTASDSVGSGNTLFLDQGPRRTVTQQLDGIELRCKQCSRGVYSPLVRKVTFNSMVASLMIFAVVFGSLIQTYRPDWVKTALDSIWNLH
jgi:hypothetical protein